MRLSSIIITILIVLTVTYNVIILYKYISSKRANSSDNLTSTDNLNTSVKKLDATLVKTNNINTKNNNSITDNTKKSNELNFTFANPDQMNNSQTARLNITGTATLNSTGTATLNSTKNVTSNTSNNNLYTPNPSQTRNTSTNPKVDKQTNEEFDKIVGHIIILKNILKGVPECNKSKIYRVFENEAKGIEEYIKKNEDSMREDLQIRKNLLNALFWASVASKNKRLSENDIRGLEYKFYDT